VSSGIAAVIVAAAAPPLPPGGAALSITAVSSPYWEVLRLSPPLPMTLALAAAGVAALLATLDVAVGRSLRASLGTTLVSSPLGAAATAAPLVPWLAAHPAQTALLAQSVGLSLSAGAAAAAGPAALSAVAKESDGRWGELARSVDGAALVADPVLGVKVNHAVKEIVFRRDVVRGLAPSDAREGCGGKTPSATAATRFRGTPACGCIGTHRGGPPSGSLQALPPPPPPRPRPPPTRPHPRMLPAPATCGWPWALPKCRMGGSTPESATASSSPP